MIKKLEIVGIIFTATNVIVFFDKRILVKFNYDQLHMKGNYYE